MICHFFLFYKIYHIYIARERERERERRNLEFQKHKATKYNPWNPRKLLQAIRHWKQASQSRVIAIHALLKTNMDTLSIYL